ncbi:MAG: hypothetical protein ABFE07_07855 [Armatimonadia bacterium]
MTPSLPTKLAALVFSLYALTSAANAAVTASWDFTRPTTWHDEAGSTPDTTTAGTLWPGSQNGLSLRSPVLNLPTEPFQTLELTLTFEHPGLAHLLWQGEGFGRPQTAWQGALPLQVPADGQPHDLRLLPFWQDIKNIESLRLVAPPGTRLRLKSFRIVTPDLHAADHVNWNFASEVQAGQWLPHSGAVLQPRPDGLQVTLREPSAVVVSPSLQAPTFNYEWLSARITAPQPARLKLQWATSGARGLHGPAVILRPGTHTYNVRASGTKSWAGQLRGLALELSGNPGATMTIHSLDLGQTPEGPAELRTLYAGPLEPRVHTGRAFRFLWALQNEGGQEAHDVKVSIGATGEVSLPTGPLAVSRMDHGVPEVLTWLIKADGPGCVTLQADYGDQQLREQIQLSPEPTPAENTALTLTPPATSGPIVAAHYHVPPAPLYGPDALDRVLYRRPYLGDYALSPEVIDWQLKWSLDHGVTAWIMDLGGTPADAEALDALLSSRFFRQLKFCFRWSADTPVADAGRALFGGQFATFLLQPNYLKLDGKPLVLVGSPLRRTAEGWGLADLTDLAEDLDLALVACVPLNVPESGVLQKAGYVAAADLHAEEGFPREPSPVEDWNRATAAKVPYLPSLYPAWQSNMTPQRLRTLLGIAELRVKNAPEATVPIIIAGDFNNEVGVEPRRPDGFLWLDAVRETLGLPKPEQLVPGDLGLAAFTRPHPAPPSAWEFDTKEGWTEAMGLSVLHAVNGTLAGRTDSNEPALFGGETMLDTRDFTTAVIGLSVSEGKTGRLYWRTSLRKFTRDHSLPFDLIADGATHEYRLDLTKANGWRGYLEGLRLDPTDTANATIAVDYLRLQ